jgi:hypothetical protein
LTIPPDDPAPGIRQTDWWYVSHIPYELDDQFGKKLPAVIPVREHFTEDQVEQCWVEKGQRVCSNWNRSDEGAGDLSRAQPGQLTDIIRGQPSLTFETLAIPQPFPQCPANNCIGSHLGTSTLRVQCFTGEVWVGSAEPAGVKVMELTWQRYRDHGRHCNIVSPTDGTAGPIDPCTCP